LELFAFSFGFGMNSGTNGIHGEIIMIGFHSTFPQSQNRLKSKKLRKGRLSFFNFIVGSGSVLEIFPSRRLSPPKRSKRFASDACSILKKDWERLGRDFMKTMRSTGHE